MRKAVFLIAVIYLSVNAYAQGKIGINTNTPQAMLHVKDSSVLFTGILSAGDPPVSGAGVRMMWYPTKAAFRVGESVGTEWNRDSIGTHSFAAGHTVKAKGQYSFAAGYLSQAKDEYSVAIGRQNVADANGAVAMGYGNNAMSIAAVALGYFNTAEGSYSTATGFSTKATGQMSLATGYDSEASGIVSIAGGYRSSGSGSYSMAVGFDTESRPFASLAIGRYNVITGTDNIWVDTDPVFMIGNGDDNATRRNSFTVLKNGKTAINGHVARAGLYMKGYDASDSSHIILEDNNSTQTGHIYYNSDIIFKNSRSGGDFYFRDLNDVSLWSLFNTGNVTITGTLTQNSDARLKKDIIPLTSPLEKILQLNGYHYHWKDTARDNRLQTGLLAQEIEALMPELVTTDDNGVKSVNYAGVIPYLIEAIKELKKQLENK